MIKSLYLKNFALFDEININFENGLNIITGETGSGKSLLLKSLKFLSGERFSKDFIRQGEKRCVLEVEFEVLEKITTIRRVFHQDGKSRSFLNDEPISIDQLKEISETLLDYHGQHENQKLFRPKEQLILLDQFSGITIDVEKLNSIYQSLIINKAEIKKLENEKRKFLREQEIIEFQLNEISQIQFNLEDDIDLTKKLKKISHQTEINNKLSDSNKLIKLDIVEKLIIIRRNLDYVSNLDEDFNQYAERLDGIFCEIEDISFDLEKESNNYVHNLNEIQEMNDKLAILEMLKRKYGGSLEAVLDYQNEIIEKIQNDSMLDKSLSKLKNEKQNLEKKYKNLSETISQKRIQIAPQLSPQIEEFLSQLGMENTKFQIEVDSLNEHEFFPYGNNKCDFKIASSKSGEVKQLNKIASGGEISRIQLALKMLNLNNKSNETIVFDEIDTGISGKIADMTGKVMQKIAKNQQVLCITHLPQIAGKGDFHFVPKKNNLEKDIKIEIKKLNKNEKIKEIASLMSGNKITQTSKERAKEILKVQ